MELVQAEHRLGVTLSDRHRRAMLDPTDPIHDACDFLVPNSPFKGLQWVNVNESLHAADHPDRWPVFLVAFASNGCADYFAFDIRFRPPKIVYMDPDQTVDENLTSTDGFEFGDFEDWYDMKTERRRTRR